MIATSWIRRYILFAFCVLLASCGGSDVNEGASHKASASSGDGSTPTTIALAQASSSIAQSAGTLAVSVTRRGNATGTASVGYATADGTATAGADYAAASGTLTWGAGDTTPQIINIAINNAVPFVGTRSFGIQLSGASGDASLGTITAATTTIIGAGTVSSGNPGTLSLTASVYTVSLGAGNLVVTAIRTGGSTGTVSVAYATADGTSVAGTDYTAASGTLIWQDGDTSPQTITIPISDASPFTGSRNFSIALAGTTGGATLGTPSSATATINGNAAPGTIALPASSYSVAQSGGSLSVTVTRSGGSTGAVSVSYGTANGSAVAGSDYTAANGTLSWADGDSTVKTITIAVSSAVPFSGSRTFTLALSGTAGGAVLGTPNSATVTINGSGAVGTIALGESSYSVAQSAGSLAVTAVRTGGSVGAVSVSYATANITAVAGTDYTATNGTLSWANGDTAPKTFTIAVSNTTPFAGTRSFSITLSGNTGSSTLGSPSATTVNITGSAGANGTLAFSSATLSVAQTAGSMTLTAMRTGGSSGAVSVTYATANGTAIAGTDFTAAQGTLSWAAGDSSAKTLQIALVSPAAYSGTRSFTVALSSPLGGATLGSPKLATATINGSAHATAPGCTQSGSRSVSTFPKWSGSNVLNGLTTYPNSLVEWKATSIGVVASATSTTITDTYQTWPANMWVGTLLQYNNINYLVTENTANTVTIDSFAGGPSSFSTTPKAGSMYYFAANPGTNVGSGPGGQFAQHLIGTAPQQYAVNLDAWGGSSVNSIQWIQSYNCWGAFYDGPVGSDSSSTITGSEQHANGSFNNYSNGTLGYPSASRGFSSATGTTQAPSYVTGVGMGVQLSAMTKANAHWSMATPSVSNNQMRGDALMDVYWFSNLGTKLSFPPTVDMQIMQMIWDNDVNFTFLSSQPYAYQKTISGVTYWFVASGSTNFNQPGGNTVTFFALPNPLGSSSTPSSQVWGSASMTHDIRAMGLWLSETNPLDDYGNPIKDKNGVYLSSYANPVIPSTYYLGAVNVGFELNYMPPDAEFITNNFWVAMQSEADGPSTP